MSNKNRKNRTEVVEVAAPITGTAKELISRGFTVNGVALDQPAISVLHRLGLATLVGTVSPKDADGKVTRGKPSSILSFAQTLTITFAANAEIVAETPAIVAPEAEAPTTSAEGESESTGDAAPAEIVADSAPITADETLPEIAPQAEVEAPAATVEA